jgi:hypothetical protein
MELHYFRNKDSNSSQRIICVCNELLVMDRGRRKDGRILEEILEASKNHQVS